MAGIEHTRIQVCVDFRSGCVYACVLLCEPDITVLEWTCQDEPHYKIFPEPP